MEISSVHGLFETLIYYSIQRCRVLEDLCRLSVVLKPLSDSINPLTRVSVSDTGVGSSLEEFKELRYCGSPWLDNKWDGLLSVATTGISDPELHNININLKELIPSRRLTKLPSCSKNGAKFSGTEVSLLTSETADDLLAQITFFLQKMLILKYPKVAFELLVSCGSEVGSEHDTCILAIECSSLPSSATYLEWMKLGLENYILQHGNRRESVCNSCFPSREHLKVGDGIASYLGSHRSSGKILECVIVISEILEQASPCSCMRVNSETEILYFENFTPSSIPQLSVEALRSIKWGNYGLTLRSVSERSGHACLEWDNLPPQVHIDIALHFYSKEVGELLSPRSSKLPKTLTRKAVINALNELKAKNEGVLLSAHALKICNYAPDLARTISRLILNSNDLNFKGECISLLGLQSQEMEENAVEDGIRERILHAIGVNDRKSRTNKEAPSILFEDDYSQNSELLDMELEGEEYCSLDL